MKKKTKITLAVLTSLMVGGGIGTAIGFGVWGTHDDKPAEVSSEATPEPVRDSDISGEPADSVYTERPAIPKVAAGLARPAPKRAAIPSAFSSARDFVSSLTEVGTAELKSAPSNETSMSKGYKLPNFSKSGFTDVNGLLILKMNNQSTSSLNVSKLSFTNQFRTTESDQITYIVRNYQTGEWVSGSPRPSCPQMNESFYVFCNAKDMCSQWMAAIEGVSSVTVCRSSRLDYGGLKNGETKDIYVDVDKNYSKDTIISSVSAKDLFGQDVPVTVTEGLDAFTPQTIGVYTLKLKATDSYGQTATATLIIHICDYVGPNVTQKKQLTFTADKGQKLDYGDLAFYISVTDNGTSHGSSVTVTYAYDGTTMNTDWAKTFTAADYGTHNVKVTARDGSGNTTEKTFVLKVNDGTAPVISRKDGQEVGSTITVGLSKVFSMNTKDILAMYKATDNVDGDVSASLAGVGDEDKNFFANNHHVGSYTLHITAKDKDNNASTLNIPIVISADMPPVFLISDTLVYTDTATPLTTAALAKVITNGVLAKKNIASLNIDASDYIGNEDKAGTYKVTYDYTEAAVVKAARRFNAASEVKSGSLDIVVTEAENVKEDEKETTNFFAKAIKAIKDFFKKIAGFFQKLGNWFRGVFTKFKFDCFITNDEWDLRFGKEVKASDSAVLAPSGEDSAGK